MSREGQINIALDPELQKSFQRTVLERGQKMTPTLVTFIQCLVEANGFLDLKPSPHPPADRKILERVRGVMGNPHKRPWLEAALDAIHNPKLNSLTNAVVELLKSAVDLKAHGIFGER